MRGAACRVTSCMTERCDVVDVISCIDTRFLYPFLYPSPLSPHPTTPLLPIRPHPLPLTLHPSPHPAPPTTTRTTLTHPNPRSSRLPAPAPRPQWLAQTHPGGAAVHQEARPVEQGVRGRGGGGRGAVQLCGTSVGCRLVGGVGVCCAVLCCAEIVLEVLHC